MIVLGVVGKIGSGKDTVANYIGEHGFLVLNMADIFREMARREGYSTDRKTMQKLRVEKGRTFLAEETVRVMKASEKDKIIVTSIRMSDDWIIIKKAFPAARLITVDASPDTRFERLASRERDKVNNREEFDEQEKRENEIYDFEKTFSMADYTISNEVTKKDLYKLLEDILKKIGKARE